MEKRPEVHIRLRRKRVARLRRPAIAAGRGADELPENAIEMSERLESHIVSDLADATIAVKQERLGFLDSYPGEVIGEGEADRAFEEFAKIKCTRVHCFRDRGQADRVVLISGNELLRAGDRQRLSG